MPIGAQEGTQEGAARGQHLLPGRHERLCQPVTRRGAATGALALCRSEQFKIARHLAAVPAFDQFETDLLVIGQPGEAGLFDGRDMHEHVRAALFGFDEPVSFLVLNHFTVPFGMAQFSFNSFMARQSGPVFQIKSLASWGARAAEDGPRRRSEKRKVTRGNDCTEGAKSKKKRGEGRAITRY